MKVINGKNLQLLLNCKFAIKKTVSPKLITDRRSDHPVFKVANIRDVIRTQSNIYNGAFL